MSEATTEPQEAANDYFQQLRQKILFGLSIYQYLSPSMLHVFLGTSTPSKIWKEQVLAKMIEDGEVIFENVTLTSPVDRAQNYGVLHLPENAFIPPQDAAATTTDPQHSRAPDQPSDQPVAA